MGMELPQESSHHRQPGHIQWTGNRVCPQQVPARAVRSGGVNAQRAQRSIRLARHQHALRRRRDQQKIQVRRTPGRGHGLPQFPGNKVLQLRTRHSIRVVRLNRHRRRAGQRPLKRRAIAGVDVVLQNAGAIVHPTPTRSARALAPPTGPAPHTPATTKHSSRRSANFSPTPQKKGFNMGRILPHSPTALLMVAGQHLLRGVQLRLRGSEL